MTNKVGEGYATCTMRRALNDKTHMVQQIIPRWRYNNTPIRLHPIYHQKHHANQALLCPSCNGVAIEQATPTQKGTASQTSTLRDSPVNIIT